ncbi:hypothetical protein F511_06761 [Dorcoceras hygrometricum]|uniref:R3H domain-containing protein 2-like n=1 Tax=Dorcoceras hygrometricum TaxID=472368 RepID=A0A2Z7D6N1_9LAMI|nr:hypothetical protein F511_06761 [Dorcoceras hygrometricum]
MDSAALTSLDPSDDSLAPPESWEAADVDASMRRLMISSRKDSSSTNTSSSQPEIAEASGLVLRSSKDDLIQSVDQFLREAIQNPRERLSVLRMEQDIEKFIRDPTRDQMEFQHLPTSYLRLAAHRVAQHYSLQSMVLLDNNLPDGSGSRIIVRKTANIRLPLIRLADIPVNLPTEEGGALKVAIKQRPQKGSQTTSNLNVHLTKSNSSKSVEERKEEYNRARARIFSSSSSVGSSSSSVGSSSSSVGSSSGKPETEHRTQDGFQRGPMVNKRAEERLFPVVGPDVNISRSYSESSVISSRITGSMTEKEPIGRPKTNNRVAIFRDRDGDRKDPDYDRRYDRYMQRFDPGFGFCGGAYTIQPMYTPALNYNTEFPQLGSGHGQSSISSEHVPRPVPQHLHRPWASPSAPTGIGYGPTEAMLSPFSPGNVNVHASSGLYLNSPQYPCHPAGLPYIHPHEQVHQPFSQV